MIRSSQTTVSRMVRISPELNTITGPPEVIEPVCYRLNGDGLFALHTPSEAGPVDHSLVFDGRIDDPIVALCSGQRGPMLDLKECVQLFTDPQVARAQVSLGGGEDSEVDLGTAGRWSITGRPERMIFSPSYGNIWEASHQIVVSDNKRVEIIFSPTAFVGSKEQVTQTVAGHWNVANGTVDPVMEEVTHVSIPGGIRGR